MSEVTIEVEKREDRARAPTAGPRRAGKIPAVVYGGGKETVPIQVDRKILVDILKKGGGENPIFLLKLAGTDKSRHAMIRDMQIDPVTRQVVAHRLPAHR